MIAHHLLFLLKPKRKPDFVIGNPDNPYLLRWWLIPRNRWLNVYLHRIRRSDDDRAKHDHPWLSVSLMLAGEIIEHFDWHRHALTRHIRAGHLTWRSPWFAHRLEVRPGHWGCWTLFITGPIMRKWGFHCPETSPAGGWRYWKDFTAPADRGQIGKGCD